MLTSASLLQCLCDATHRRTRRELLDGLHKVGFRTHLGPDGTGFLAMARRRGGGYYLGTCASPESPAEAAR